LIELINRTIKNLEPVNRAEVVLKRKSGEDRISLGVSTSLIHDLNGEILGVTAIFQDITNLKRLNTMSIQTLRLKAIVEMSASIAHEIKNPLSSIQSSLDLLEYQSTAEERKRVIEMARKESKRLWALLDDFLRLARIQVKEWNPIHLRELVEEVKALVMVRSDISSRIMIQIQGFGDGDQDVVWGDPELLKQVFLNLFINSAEAIDGMGKIRIFLEEPSAASSVEQGKEKCRHVVVEDDGSGFTSEAVERAFEPFFTTKEDGSGLGLAITRKIIEAHFGRIELFHAEGRGARFVLSFPEQKPAGFRDDPQPRLVEKESG
jgi:signal transduction histidine kinase